MRRVGVLFVLFGVMLGVSALRAESAGLRDSMILAAIGFVLLAAFTLAELGSALSLPRVTGYILAGTALGPSIADILSKGVVREMQMFNTLALGLIAIAAGLELDARQIVRLWRTLAATIIVKVVLGVTVVGGVIYAWETAFGAIGIAPASSRAALALVFGALSIGTSPAIALAVTTELRSKGRLSELVLGAAVLKDLVVVVTLAISITIAQSLIGASVAPASHIIAEVSRELGMSIAVGAALGGLLVLYLRYIRAEMLLFVAAMILVVAEVSRALHLELLLLFITAGFVVRNLSRFGHDLMKPVQLVALPVFVVFFTNAGASIDLSRTAQVLPLALVFAISRAAVYYVAGRLGGTLGNEAPSIRHGAWLGYLPQAGVTLGLVGVAATKLPSLAGAITTLGMAAVAVNLLAGPIALRFALRRAGEVPSTKPHTVAAESDTGTQLATEEGQRRQRLEDVVAATRHQRIATLARDTASELRGLHAELLKAHLTPWVDSLSQEATRMLAAPAPEQLATLAAWSATAPTVLAPDRSEQLHELFRRARQHLRRLPETATLPYFDQHGVPEDGDSLVLRISKSCYRLRRRLGGNASRTVPVAAAARVAIEGRLLRAYLEVARQSNATEARVLADLQRVALGHLDHREAATLVTDRLREFLRLVERDMDRALTLGTAEFIRLLQDAGSPSLPLSAIRYSVTEAEVGQLLLELDRESLAWTHGLLGSRNALHLAAILGGARGSTLAVLEQSVLTPLQDSVTSSALVLREVGGKVRVLEERLAAHHGDQPTDVATLRLALTESFSEAVWEHLEHDAARFRSDVSTHRVALEARRALELLPQTIAVSDVRVLAVDGKPHQVVLVDLAAAGLWQETLLKGLLPGVDEDVRQTALAMVTITQRLRDAEETATYALEHLQGEATAADRALASKALGRAATRLEEQANTLTETRNATVVAIRQRTDAAFESLCSALLEPTKATEKAVRRALLRRVFGGARQLREVLTRWREGLSTTLHRVGHSDVSRDLLSRYRKAHLDAMSLHEHVLRSTTTDTVPAPYARLFSLDPLVGPRLFVAYRRQLATLIEAERNWLEGRLSSALVVGAHGSGRSSLLNQCKLELSAPRVIRPEPLQWRRELGLMAALGVCLGVPPSADSIARALSSTKTTILVDDLEQWLSPDLAGLAALESFLDLVVQTADTAFWIVIIESSAFSLFQEMLPLAHAFGVVIRLEPLNASELREAIEERHRISGRTLRHASAPLSAIRNRLPGLADHDVSWRVLTGLSDGNLSRGLSLWLQGVALQPDDSIEIAVQRLLRAALPFVGWLHPRDQAVLAQLARFGPLRQSRLAQLLGFGRTDVVRRLAFLRAAGLVEGGQVEQEPASIPALLRPTVLHGLRFFQVKS